VRPQFEKTYHFENIWFRDTAKGLAELRDAEALIETYDDLLDKFSDQIDRRAFAPMRRALSQRKKKIFEETGNLSERLKKIRVRMDKASERIADWKLDEFDGVEAGLVATYRKAYKTMVAAYDNPVAKNFHEWRKQAKYHNYHMRLVHDLWKPVLDSLFAEIKSYTLPSRFTTIPAVLCHQKYRFDCDISIAHSRRGYESKAFPLAAHGCSSCPNPSS
jgi:CHAD domain-containing protein